MRKKREGKDNSFKLSIIFALICIAVIRFNMPVYGLPNRGEYKPLSDYMKHNRESDVESSRTENPQRKASELKKPWLSDNLLEMETALEPYDFPEGDVRDYPDYHFTPPIIRGQPRAGGGDGGALCAFYQPNIMIGHECEGTRETVLRLGLLQGIVTGLTASGPGSIGQTSLMEFPVTVYQNVTEGTMTLDLEVSGFDGSTGTCSAKVIVQCPLDEGEECDCSPGVTPTINYIGDTLVVGNNKEVWVDSGGLACPPYNWEVTGLGYSMSQAQTTNDIEKTAIIGNRDACGVDYDVTMSVTVTDACGKSDTVIGRHTDGQWGVRDYDCDNGASAVKETIIIGATRYSIEHEVSIVARDTTPCSGGNCPGSPPGNVCEEWLIAEGYSSIDWDYSCCEWGVDCHVHDGPCGVGLYRRAIPYRAWTEPWECP